MDYHLARSPRRHVVLDEEEAVKLNPTELAAKHNPMPGIDLMEMLGEISKRREVSYLPSPNTSIHETSFTSIGSRNTMSMVTSRQSSTSRLGIKGAYRKRVH